MFKFATEIIPIIPYKGVVFPFMGSLSGLFLDALEGNANISAAIKSSSTVSPPFLVPMATIDADWLYLNLDSGNATKLKYIKVRSMTGVDCNCTDATCHSLSCHVSASAASLSSSWVGPGRNSKCAKITECNGGTPTLSVGSL